MCCPTTNSSNAQRFGTPPAVDCGCGCVGQDPSRIQLETYRDHLKVELKAVEKKIHEMEAESP